MNFYCFGAWATLTSIQMWKSVNRFHLEKILSNVNARSSHCFFYCRSKRKNSFFSEWISKVCLLLFFFLLTKLLVCGLLQTFDKFSAIRKHFDKKKMKVFFVCQYIIRNQNHHLIDGSYLSKTKSKKNILFLENTMLIDSRELNNYPHFYKNCDDIHFGCTLN